jgi:HK97 family phage portal protein
MALADRVALRAGERRDVHRSDPVTMEEFGYLLGRGRSGGQVSAAGVRVGANRAMGITAWYSGVRYLAETVASLPVHTYQGRSNERSRRADPLWLTHPDAEQTWFGLVEHWMMSLLHAGNAYAFKVRNVAGQVVGLRELHPDRVTVAIAPDGTKRFMVDRDDTPYTSREVLHVPGLAYDGRTGLNPLRIHTNSLGGVAAADEYAQKFFGQGTHLGGLISMPDTLSAEQARDLRDQWDEFHQGLRHAHQTGVLGNGATYTPLALKAQDAQLIESRQFGVTEIARILRIPPHKLYELSRATFSNIEHQSIEAVVDSIRPWVERFEAWINADTQLLPAGNFVEFQLEGLLRGDAQARSAYYTAGVMGGWLSPKRAAELENQPAPDELDYFLRPLNMAVIVPGQGVVATDDPMPAGGAA